MSIDTTWVVLAGGRGTRSADPRLPKVLQQVWPGASILSMLLECINDEETNVVIAVSYGAEEVIQEARKLQPLFPKLHISWVLDEGLGPVDALLKLRKFISTEFVAVALGDTAVRAPLLSYLTQFKKAEGFAAGVVARQSRHLFDSDKVAINLHGEIQSYAPKGDWIPSNKGQIWGLTGVTFFRSRDLFRIRHPSSDIAKAAFGAFDFGEILVIRTSEYFRDSGTRARLEQIRADMTGSKSGGNFRRSSPKPALFVDRDGTLMPDISEGRRELKSSELFAGTIDFLRESKLQGFKLFLVTNQPAVAKGFIDYGDVYHVHNELQAELVKHGAEFDDFEFCPHHPESGFVGERPEIKVLCKCRKPKAGMIAELLKRHSIDLSSSRFLGDSEDDALLAEEVGITFINIRHLTLRSWSSE